jgi:hypothetical protein
VTVKKIITVGSLSLALLAFSGCDEDEPHADQLGGGPGSTTPAANVQASGDGYCEPAGGGAALGQADYITSSTAKIDSDGDPLAQGHDADWQAETSGKVNGGSINSAQYSYVVMSQTQMYESGVRLGDWALVTNNETGRQTWARVGDVGPEGGSGEISEAAASAVGIQYDDRRFTVGNPSVSVQAYSGTAAIQSDCSTALASTNP